MGVEKRRGEMREVHNKTEKERNLSLTRILPLSLSLPHSQRLARRANLAELPERESQREPERGSNRGNSRTTATRPPSFPSLLSSFFLFSLRLVFAGRMSFSLCLPSTCRHAGRLRNPRTRMYTYTRIYSEYTTTPLQPQTRTRTRIHLHRYATRVHKYTRSTHQSQSLARTVSLSHARWTK